ncbi:MAG: family 78 glycoside hydrolase catalytic domain [Cyclobacteriaceae bacterium]
MKINNLKTEYTVNPLGLETSAPRLSWQIQSAQKAVAQTAYQITCALDEKDLLFDQNSLWGSGKVESDQSIHVEYAGPALKSAQRVYWKVQIWDNHGNESTSEEVAFFEMGLLNQSDWAAGWITFPWENNLKQTTLCPYFRKEFKAQKEVSSARVYVSALGLYELELNGAKVGDEVFAPGWTNYHRRLQYQVYDITAQVSKGANAIGAIIGDGWYRGHFGWWENNRNGYGDQLGLLCQIHLTFVDGSEEIISTDESWKAATGPILKSDIYNGETYDARLEMGGWSSVGFDDKNWQTAKILDHTKSLLTNSVGEKVKKIQELKPIEIITTPKGEKVFDLGQNMVGWVRLKVKGQAGEQIILKFAEVLDKEGNFYTENLRNIECTDRYILKGEGEETYEPRFTFHGFRYVMVDGYPGELSKESITGIVVHSDMLQTGSFECSDSMINQLQSNIQWGQKGNFLDVPTDCPQRDERLGWTGDAQVFAPTASFNFNTAPFFTKWLRDLATEQKEDGSVPWVVPNNIEDGGGTGWSDGFGATGWADAAVVIPWVLFQSYGDIRILEEQYSSMKAWVDYMIHHAGESYIFDYGFHFGDWLSFAEYESYNYNAPDYGFAGAHTDKALIATAYFYYSSTLLLKCAELIGKSEDVVELTSLLPKIKEAWNEEFMTRTGRLVSSTQAAYAIGLVFDIVAEDKKEIIAKRLADDVSYFGHLTTGFLGTPVLNYALSDTGSLDLAYQLLHNDRYPSWLYPVTMGATTIWERWDGIRPDGTFQTTGMNSFNHYAYGAIGEWLYSRVAGLRIDPEKPGYKNIIFNPHPGGKLNWAKAEIETMFGKASAAWELLSEMVTYVIEIPVNTTGTIILNTADISSVMMDAKPLTESVEFKINNDKVEFKLGSGKYTINYSE